MDKDPKAPVPPSQSPRADAKLRELYARGLIPNPNKKNTQHKG